MHNDFLRVASVTPEVFLADPMANARSIVAALEKAADMGADVAVCPELCITGYTCGDLFHDQTLLDASEKALRHILESDAKYPVLCVVGMPVRAYGTLYNCAVAFSRGRILAVVPKTYLPSYNEFYEHRWFASAFEEQIRTVPLAGQNVPMGTWLYFNIGNARVGIEICEDLWAPAPPSTNLTLGGVEVMLNLSASPDAIGKYDYLMSLLLNQSARTICGYVYAASGNGESSTDLVFTSKNIVCENGTVIASGERLKRGPSTVVADIDLAAIRHDRMHNTTFTSAQRRNVPVPLMEIMVENSSTQAQNELLRYVDPHPFVPGSKTDLKSRCREIIDIQALGLCRRLEATKSRKLVIGISGGLDSTLALLVACRAFDILEYDHKGIIGITMPGFGTTGRTHSNALTLMEVLGVTSREIKIGPAVLQHFSDIGHDPEVHDVTYENSQARERTQILMDVANQEGALVLGTGDLSELALGWATYNGDHMSMYGVNSGVPKTLVRHLVHHLATEMPEGPGRSALIDIVETPISPELIPADSKDNITQVTEDLVGPYELHDFFLYYTIRYGFSPRRILFMAENAFADEYPRETLIKWLRTFFRRFFAQQFKRSCLPDGPKVGSITLSPRGDWRMPSDALSDMWLRECDEL
ncbi:MAG: NAD(+) synthase [Muribaculaceae bacterium]|nr:NAD(+) synthase [Muribaculaceae bacterium]